MASLYFFAARNDLVQILDFVFSQPGTVLFELSSRYDSELKSFHSTQEVLEYQEIGTDEYGSGKRHTFQLWSPLVMPRPEPERITLTPGAVKGHTFRYAMDGCGLMQLYLGGGYGDGITLSYFGHWTEQGARIAACANRDQSQLDQVAWVEFRKLSGKIQYLLRRKLSPARVSGYLVLTEAYRMYQNGFTLGTAKGGVGYNIPSALHQSLVCERR